MTHNEIIKELLKQIKPKDAPGVHVDLFGKYRFHNRCISIYTRDKKTYIYPIIGNDHLNLHVTLDLHVTRPALANHGSSCYYKLLLADPELIPKLQEIINHYVDQLCVPTPT